MRFVHGDADFEPLLRAVAEAMGIDPSLVEKDYWVTHCMWALHQTGLELWFKGGTSLSKGYGVVQRFSEDLDLMVRHGTVSGLPAVRSWTSLNKGQVEARREFYRALLRPFVIPDVQLEIVPEGEDKQARGIILIGRYPGVMLKQLSSTMSPYVLFEIGRARVVPFVERPLTSFVHDFLERRGQLGEYIDNRPIAVRCVHPLVTLVEKLDALSRRFSRERFEPDAFARHYEDAVHIIRSLGRLPAIEQSPRALADEMLVGRDIRAIPSAEEPALTLADADRREAVERALTRIGGMFWGPRIPLGEACATIQAWIEKNLR